MIVLYNLFLWLLFPYIVLRLIWRARIQKEYLHHIGERFGFYSEHCDKPVIWLHTVSVGETRAVQGLVVELAGHFPHHQILLTHTTPTGRAASKQLFGDGIIRVYLPYDYSFAVGNFLSRFKPTICILMETEIWVNLISACHHRHIPTLILNARMSEKSFQGYKRFSRLTRYTLEKVSAVAAQTDDDATRLANLGAKNISTIGNLKFDINPPGPMLRLGAQLRELLGEGRNVLLAASTREDEEILILDALKDADIKGLLLLIVPRHPQRFAVVARLLEQYGIQFVRRSEILATQPDGEFKQLQHVPPGVQVVLGDSMGEMFAYYAASDLAFIGGSLLPYGGQNLIESCAVGTPVLFGPHMFNFSDAASQAISAGAAIQVAGAPGIFDNAQRLFRNSEKLNEMRLHCADFVVGNRGATSKALELASQYIENVTRPGF